MAFDLPTVQVMAWMIPILALITWLARGFLRYRSWLRMIAGLRPGDQIITSFGFMGIVQNVDGAFISIRLKDGTPPLTIHYGCVVRTILDSQKSS